MFPKDSTLPPKGSTFERAAFDLKGHPDAYRKGGVWNEFEIAKDAAAFANVGGGRILVGGVEGKKRTPMAGTLDTYNAFDSSVATEFKEKFECVVKMRCHPAPMIDVEPVAQDGGFVAIVHIATVPGALVGVDVAAADPDHKGAAFVFPRRMGTQTEYLTPEQVAMYTDARFRRMITLLRSITGGVRLHYVEAYRSTRSFSAVRVDEETNSVSLTGPVGGADGAPDTSFTLDAIHSVWRDTKGWHVAIDARWAQMANE